MLEIVESETSVNLLRIFIPELLYNAEVIEPFRTKLIGQLVGFFSGYYTRLQELGHVGSHVDPTFLAQMILSCLFGFVMRRYIVGDPTVAQYYHQELAILMTTIILNGIEAR